MFWTAVKFGAGFTLGKALVNGVATVVEEPLERFVDWCDTTANKLDGRDGEDGKDDRSDDNEYDAEGRIIVKRY